MIEFLPHVWPLDNTVARCLGCGALLLRNDTDIHAAWHRKPSAESKSTTEEVK